MIFQFPCVENLIGKGGYAEVYKGRLRDGRLVAIKRLTKGTPDEIIGDFLSELGIMAHVKHRNTAKLIGYCVEGGMHLVLEYFPNGSLASVLYGQSYYISPRCSIFHRIYRLLKYCVTEQSYILIRLHILFSLITLC